MSIMQFVNTRRYEIWLAELPLYAESHVQGGRRPVIIMNNTPESRFNVLVTIIPLTSRFKRMDLKSHVEINNTGLRKPSVALCEQLQVINSKLLTRRLGFVKSPVERRKIENAVMAYLGLDNTEKSA